MKHFEGNTLSWQVVDGAIELLLHRAPCNEIGTATLIELERFVAALDSMRCRASRCYRAILIEIPRFYSELS